jgi:hypothetical protein
MSKNDCGCDCGCKKIIVQCAPGAGEPPPGAPPTRYSCVNGQCVTDPNGAYTSLGACLEACRVPPPPPPPPPAIRYSCVNGQCVQDPIGNYASLGACMEACRTLPPPQPVCDRVRVTFISLHVTDDGETGDGDWTLYFDVNGVFNSHEFADDSIDDGQNLDYQINVFVDVPIDPFTTDLTVRVTGLERDSGVNGGDDPLTVAERTFPRSDNFGIGRVHTIPSNPPEGDQIGDYQVRVRIDCLNLTTSVVSLTTLRQAASWRLERENRKRARYNLPPLPTDDAALLGRSLSYLRKKGWTLKTILGENFILEGVGDRIDLRTSDPRPKTGKG